LVHSIGTFNFLQIKLQKRGQGGTDLEDIDWHGICYHNGDSKRSIIRCMLGNFVNCNTLSCARRVCQECIISSFYRLKLLWYIQKDVEKMWKHIQMKSNTPTLQLWRWANSMDFLRAFLICKFCGWKRMVPMVAIVNHPWLEFQSEDELDCSTWLSIILFLFQNTPKLNPNSWLWI
jgi:hypothetical protein